MSKEMQTAIKEMKKLFWVWNVIENDYSDCEEKVTAQQVINNLIITRAEDIAAMFNEDNS